MGSFANTWELASGTLVGVSDDAFTFDNRHRVPDVPCLIFNLKAAIIALEPDFVIMTSGTGGRATTQQADFKSALDASGIPWRISK
ncbi:MAG: hypothetical protein ACLT98_17720 [Eggerthellaceae bacterium]